MKEKRLTAGYRFGVAYDGRQYWVIDAFSQNWYPMNDKTHAEDRAQAWEYEVQECLDGKDRFSGDIA